MKPVAETAAVEFVPDVAAPAIPAKEPPLWAILLMFWGVFAAAVAITALLNPDLFVRADPDSLMRLVQVRDLLAGQGWFDLMQYRMDPPTGVLMHWSRVIDAPVAALIMLGNLFGIGEPFALTAWPLILLLGLMAAVMLTATALAGRAAAVPALILSLFFLDPLLNFLPNDIDHHNVQYALTALSLAMALRLDVRPALGVTLGGACALMLAIGLETLPYVTIFGAAVALLWAFKMLSGRGAALFGISFAALTPALYILTGSAVAPLACDALSWALAMPAALAGLGLAALVFALHKTQSSMLRIAGLGVLGGATLATLLLLAPSCLNGPYGNLSPEMKVAWLDAVSEAQPIYAFAAREPLGAIGTLAPPIAAFAVALWQVWFSRGRRRVLWALPLAVLTMALTLGFYQVRTLPYSNVATIAVLGAWLAELVAQNGVTSLRPIRAAVPVLIGFLVACPFTYLAVGWVAVQTVSLATGGRIAPPQAPVPPATLTAGLSSAEMECLDPASAALLGSVPKGLVLAPLFYGPAVLKLSPHSVVAGPYHRAGQAIFDVIQAINGPPAEARAVINARKVDYVAICSTSQESTVVAGKAPDGLLARLLSRAAPAWLLPVPAKEGTALRLWQVKDLAN
jgi:hypothetical protein